MDERWIVGLGNPGHTYHATRHNVGFQVIDALARRHGVRVDQRLVNPADGRPAAVYGDAAKGKQRLRLIMPLAMMNESGDVFRALPASRPPFLIVCDDVNLPLGKLRMRSQGGAGGHHGLQSCLDVLGTEQVARLRVGVGTPTMPRELHEFVISNFTPEERPVIKDAIGQAAEACQAWAREGLEAVMSRYNATTIGPE